MTPKHCMDWEEDEQLPHFIELQSILIEKLTES